MQNRTTSAYLMLISAMLVFGTIGIFRRYIPLSSGLIAFSRGVMGGVFLLVFIILRHRGFEKISKRQLLLLIISGAVMGLNWILLFEAYNYTTVATATMCYYMQPTIVILLSPIVLHERLTGKKLLCALAAIVGMVFVSGVAQGAAITSRDVTGIFCGLGAAIFYASVILLNKLVTVENAYQKTTIQLFAASATLIPYLLATEDWGSIALDARAIIMVLVIGIVHTGISYALYFGSMQKLPAQSVAVLSYIDPVFALLLSAAVLGESLSLLGVLGAVLIIGSAVISEINPKR